METPLFPTMQGASDMADKLPWFPFYINDWETDQSVRLMGPVARSYFLALLIIQWREGVLPDSRKILERLLRLPPDPLHENQDDHIDHSACIDQVLECFISDGEGGIFNKRLKDLRTQHVKIKEAKSKGGKIAQRVFQDTSKTLEGHLSQSESESESKKTIPPSKTDGRYVPFVEALNAYWKFKNPTLKFSLGKGDGKNLKTFLAEHPGLTLEQFRSCLNNRGKSDVVHSAEIRRWIGRTLEFANGPLDQYWHPLKNGKSISPANGSGTPDAGEYHRQRLEKKRQEEAQGRA